MSETVKRITELQLCGSDSRAQSYNEGLKAAIHILESCEQPQLNENQQKYLKELQYNRERLGNTHDALFFGLVDYEKRWNFNDENFAQVLKIFANLALEQEEE